MSSVLFHAPSIIRSVIVEDISGFSVSALLTKSVLDNVLVNHDSRILILGTELHPKFPSTTSAWNSLLDREVTEYQNVISEQNINDENAYLNSFFKRIQNFCDTYKSTDIVLVTNLTSLLLTTSPSKVSRLLGKLYFLVLP